ncbi:MAG: stage V sporulation protein AA [Lachnospiraceae bacterium]|nr:stage V sporulation protein AA [Lachnospiraceae bacterium]
MKSNRTVVYLKCEQDVETQAQDVFLKQLGTVYCADPHTAARCNAIKVHHFEKDGDKRCVISVLKLIRLMEEACPNICVEVVGEADILVEWVKVNKYKGIGQWAKILLVCLISFFGTAFTIMAYHNDIGINEVFAEIYRMVMNAEPGGVNTLEVSYSVGLAAGIIIFFNHIGGRRITKDPTPLEVAMRNYEDDVNKALIELADREQKEEDV